MQSNINESLEPVTEKLNTWWDVFIQNLPNLAIALLVLLISYFISRFVYRISLKVTSKKIEQASISKLIARVSSVAVVLAGLFLALGALNLGKTLTGLLSAAGISGLVIGLALQGTLSNTISGIVLSFRKNIQIGNWLETTGYAGEVVDINLNYFVLKEADNNMVVIPNKTIMENPFKNYTLTTRMRIMIECGVGYESDLDKVERIVKNTIASSFDQVAASEDVEFYYTGFGDSSVNFLCRYWVDSENGLEKLRAKSKGIKEIRKAFEKENINIPFPIRTLQFDNNLRIGEQISKEAVSAN